MADEESLPVEVLRSDDYLAGGILFIIAFLNVFINFRNLVFYRSSALTISYFIRARAICNFSVAIVYIVYVIPVILRGSANEYGRVVDIVAAYSGSLAYTYILVLEPSVAANRLVAISPLARRCFNWSDIDAIPRCHSPIMPLPSTIQFVVFFIDAVVNTSLEVPESRMLNFLYYSVDWLTLHTIDGLIIWAFRIDAPKTTRQIFVHIGLLNIAINLRCLFFYRTCALTIAIFIVARAICNLLVALVYLAYVVPVILIGSIDKFGVVFDVLAAYLGSLAYTFILVLEPIVATNRFVAIARPTLYRRIFGIKSAKRWLFLVLLGAILTLSPDIFRPACPYYYDYEWLAWGYPIDECGETSSFYSFLLPAYICSAVTFLLNLATCFQIGWYRYVSKNESAFKKSRVHLRFFVQSSIQFVVFFVDAVVNTSLDVPESRMINFLYYSVDWLTLHTIDGFIIWAFRVQTPKPSPQAFVHVSQSISISLRR
ncbi:unnamed protein product, partial [Mesorhabditis spiculigera]